MKWRPPLSVVPWYQILAGAGDSLTGLLLLIAPARTLRLMGIARLPDSLEMVSWIGAFVLSVGLAYLVTARRPRRAEDCVRIQTVWLLTGISRAIVALFLVWKMGAGDLEWAWSTVAMTDGLLALIQFYGLSARWLVPEPVRPKTL